MPRDRAAMASLKRPPRFVQRPWYPCGAMARQKPLVVYRSHDRLGATYYLEVDAHHLLTTRLGESANIRKKIYVEHAAHEDRSRISPQLRDMLALLFTGLPEDRLLTLGVGPIEVRDPESEALVPVEPPQAHP